MLRDYQQDVYDRCRNELLKSTKRIICQLPCRSGKSYIMYEICKNAEKRGTNVLILAHRNLLLEQHRELINFKNVRINSVQTEVRHLGENGKIATILCDECHLSAADSYKKIFDYYSDAIIIGMTATPCRLDGKPLGEIYQKIIKGPTVKYLIERGYISPFDHYAPKLDINMKNVKMGDGDYNQKDLEEIMLDSKIYGDIIANYEKLAKGKQAIAYCVSIKHAEEICDLFNNNGYEARCIHSKISKKEREKILSDFKGKKFTVIVSVDCISEGISLPTCEVCLMLRPTQSYALYMQQGMRALTPSPDKRAIIIDYVGNVFRHGSLDEETEWSLTERKKCRNTSGEPEVLVRVCKECLRTYAGNGPICPYCNFNNGKTQKQIENEKQAELERIEKIEKKARRMEVGMQDTFSGIVQIARERGYKPGWCLQQAKLKHICIDWALYNKFKREL
ncbi:MAG: DEAD/DEAH box helicase [Bacilli bacterium]|nr:DEAD/DEAH box helicase [Bacilli bacterium]